jgi:nucleotide-binding universal stress UspA family protein
MTIACATHFSDSSNAAVRVAGQLALHASERLVLASVLPMNQFSDSLGARQEAEISRQLETSAAPLRARGVKVDTLVVHGSLDLALRRLCAATSAQLMVVGDSHGPFTTFFGSAAERLAWELPVPILLVRSPAPFDAWARVEAPLRVMLAIDHTWSSALAREWMSTLADYGAIDLIATHIWSPTQEYARRGLALSHEDRDHETLAVLLRAETEASLELLPRAVSHRIILEIGRGNVAQQLIEVASREHVDLIVLGTHLKHGLLGLLNSVSHEVLSRTTMSVAFIPENGAAAAIQHAIARPTLHPIRVEGFNLGAAARVPRSV